MLTPAEVLARFVHGFVQEYRRLDDGDEETGVSISDSASVDLGDVPDAPELPVGFSRPPHIE
jgi:hypothetical protein